MLPLERQTRLAELQHQLTLASSRPDELAKQNQAQSTHSGSADGSASASLSTKEQIKADFDDLVASDCLYCGELMIELVF